MTFLRNRRRTTGSWAIATILACLLVTGCQKYRADPLLPEDVFRTIEEQRSPGVVAAGTREASVESPPQAQPFTLQCAADWLRSHGPDVQDALAEYRTALALARIDTPLPNPGLEIGPQFGFGPDLGTVNRVTPFGSIGFTIPLGKRLRRQSELNRAMAEVARVQAQARFRELYLDLRSRYAELAVARTRLALRRQIAASAAQSLEAGRKLIQAGQAAALDVALFELEHQRALAEELDAERESVEVEGALSTLLGVHFERFAVLPDPALPVLPPALPEYAQLREGLIGNHTALARLRAQYEAAERALRLEIARQFPDLQIGTGWENEVGERKTVIGLTLGIELPLFDRNQQGIAEATKRREEVRVKYEAEARRALAELERAHRDLLLARRSAEIVRGKILPLAQQNVDLARQAIDTGSASALHLLEADRSLRISRVESLESAMAEIQAWVAVERAIGLPLIQFPGEEPTASAPAELSPDANPSTPLPVEPTP